MILKYRQNSISVTIFPCRNRAYIENDSNSGPLKSDIEKLISFDRYWNLVYSLVPTYIKVTYIGAFLETKLIVKDEQYDILTISSSLAWKLSRFFTASSNWSLMKKETTNHLPVTKETTNHHSVTYMGLTNKI